MAETRYYLYGASVQGIQEFIFQTNELKDIVGASELVERICTKMFDEYKGGGTIVINAAGNVKCIYDSEADCRKAVLHFPRKVMTAAPGVTISQAVVGYDNDSDFGNAVDELEAKLRAERNRPAASLTTGLLGINRSSKTGFPKRVFDDGTSDDASTHAKKKAQNLQSLCRKSFFGIDSKTTLSPKNIAYDISDITRHNDWIAVIHADGNSLGQVVQRVGHNPDEYSKFSQALDKATIAAAKAAFEKVVPTDHLGNGIVPIRPVVLGGDDMTVIIRGDLAIDYVTEFMTQFETLTGQGDLGNIIAKNHVFDDGTRCLSACAGVAFIKSSYPFYYGYQLAEELCSAAKKAAKEGLGANQPVKSCLMFHKVQDSFVTSYSDIVTRELTPKDGPSLQFGPYYISKKPDGKWSINDLTDKCAQLEEYEGVRTGIRQWLTLLHSGSGQAQQHLDRLKQVNKGDGLKLIEALTSSVAGRVAAEDCLTLYTIKNQITK